MAVTRARLRWLPATAVAVESCYMAVTDRVFLAVILAMAAAAVQVVARVKMRR